jgi:hypothetical protein
MKIHVSNLLKKFINSFSLFYDYFFTKYNGSPLDFEYSNRIINIVSNNKSLIEWDLNIDFLREDIKKNGLKDFLRLQTILRTMFVTNRVYVLKELLFVLKYLKDNNIAIDAIYESPVGNPIRYFFYPFSSGNLIHHSYSLFFYLNKYKKCINDFDFIFEFGGGYGGFSRLCSNIGYKGEYILYDLEEMSILQEYYLRSLNKFHDSKKYYNNKKHIVSNLSSIPDMSNSNVLFVALWSLSESPVEIRNKIENILRTSSSVLIAMQPYFSSIDNKEYFNSLLFDPPLTVVNGANSKKQLYLMR